MTGRTPVVVLDSFALLAFFQDEPGAEQVENLLQQAERGEVRLATTVINVGEVVYRTIRRFDVARAQLVLARIEEYAIVVDDVDRSLDLAAAMVKGFHPLAFADCLVVALAQRLGASVLTGDPEFEQVEALVSIQWLPRKPSGQSP